MADKPNMTVPTKRVRVKETDAEVNINSSDFDPELHEEIEETPTKRKPLQKRGAPTPAKPAATKPLVDDDDEDEEDEEDDE